MPDAKRRWQGFRKRIIEEISPLSDRAKQNGTNQIDRPDRPLL
jgi:hypothetical protein